MPYVKIEVTREGVTREQKQQLIKGVTDLISDVLNKDPQLTFVVIQEYDLDDWGHAYYGANYARLVKIKAKYDLHGVFRFPQSLPAPVTPGG